MSDPQQINMFPLLIVLIIAAFTSFISAVVAIAMIISITIIYTTVIILRYKLENDEIEKPNPT